MDEKNKPSFRLTLADLETNRSSSASPVKSEACGFISALPQDLVTKHEKPTEISASVPALFQGPFPEPGEFYGLGPHSPVISVPQQRNKSLLRGENRERIIARLGGPCLSYQPLRGRNRRITPWVWGQAGINCKTLSHLPPTHAQETHIVLLKVIQYKKKSQIQHKSTQ